MCKGGTVQLVGDVHHLGQSCPRQAG
jgi:hypothetical protein